MKKLTLNIDALRVEGFATVAPEGRPEGTVMGHMVTALCTRFCTEIGSCGQICP